MVQRRKALQAWAALSCGYLRAARRTMWRRLWSASAWASRCSASTAPSAPRRFADYFDYASKSDLFLTYVIINPQAERGKDWGEQDEDLVARIVDEDSSGVTIRGAKMLGTSSIMANEVFVANLQPLKAGEEDLAFSCALPMNAKGLRVLSRKSYEAARGFGLRQPALVALRRKRCADVFRRRQGAVGAPVRLSRPRHVPGAISRHPGPRLPELPGADPAVGEDRASWPVSRAASPRRSAPPTFPRSSEQLGMLAAQVGMVNAMLSGMEASGSQARRMVRAEQAFHVFGAGADPGPLPARRADRSAILPAAR